MAPGHLRRHIRVTTSPDTPVKIAFRREDLIVLGDRARVISVSKLGLAIESQPVPLGKGAILEFGLSLPGQEMFWITGEVIWKNHGQCGIKFHREDRRITMYIDQRAREIFGVKSRVSGKADMELSDFAWDRYSAAGIKRVLLVRPSPANAGFRLPANEYEVTVAQDFHGLDEIETGWPHLVLMDLGEYIENIYSSIDKYNDHPLIASAPVRVCSVWEDDMVYLIIYAGGAQISGFLPKDYYESGFSRIADALIALYYHP